MRILPIALLITLVGAASAQANVTPPTVPTALQPPAGNKAFKVGHAEGVQIYNCNGTAWTFVAPRATLFNDDGKPKIIHFAGPTWQHKDGSTAVGTVVGAPVSVTPNAIPWLLLSAKSTPGPFGDKLAATTYIQRVATKGGLAPALPCAAGTTREVPYTADYYFWKAKG